MLTQIKIPDHIICQLSHKIVVDPVTNEKTGKVYEYSTLKNWIEKNQFDPYNEEQVTSINFNNFYKKQPLTKKQAMEFVEKNPRLILDGFVLLPDNIGDLLNKTVENKECNFFTYLLKLGANINTPAPSHENNTPLISATVYNDEEFVKHILNLKLHQIIYVKAFTLNFGFGYNSTPLPSSSCLATQEEIELIKVGLPHYIENWRLSSDEKQHLKVRINELTPNINAQNVHSNTALHNACMHSNVNIIKLLMETGANHYIENNNGYTPSAMSQGAILALIKQCHRERKFALLNNINEVQLLRLKIGKYEKRIAQIEKKQEEVTSKLENK